MNITKNEIREQLRKLNTAEKLLHDVYAHFYEKGELCCEEMKKYDFFGSILNSMHDVRDSSTVLSEILKRIESTTVTDPEIDEIAKCIMKINEVVKKHNLEIRVECDPTENNQQITVGFWENGKDFLGERSCKNKKKSIIKVIKHFLKKVNKLCST